MPTQEELDALLRAREQEHLRFLTQQAADQGSELDRRQLDAFPWLQGVPRQHPALTPETEASRVTASAPPTASALPSEQPASWEPNVSAFRHWDAEPSAGGLGLAARPPAPQPARALGDVLAEQLYPGAQLSWIQKNRLAWAATQPDFLERRAQLAQKLEQQNETKRQHDLQLFEKAMASPRAPQMMQALARDPNYSMAKQAGQFARVMKEADYGALQAYREFIPEDIQQKFLQGTLSDQEMSAWVDEARTAAKENAKQSAKATLVQRALNKAPEQRTPYETQLVEEHQAALELKRADVDLKKAQAAKAQREAELGPPDHSVLNRVHQQISGGKSFEAGTPETQRQALDQYAKLYAEGRTNVLLATPAPVKERSNLIRRKDFLRSGSLVQPPAGSSEGALRSGDYIEITDKQKDAWGEIVNSGATLQSLFDMIDPLITAKTPAQAMKQYAQLSLGAVSKKNPAAATYLADSEAFSSRMARVFGSEIGVLTQGDVDRWKRALPTFGDTVAVKEAKKKVFMDIYRQSRAMAIKKIAGEDITADYKKLQERLKEAEKINPPTVEEDFEKLMGVK